MESAAEKYTRLLYEQLVANSEIEYAPKDMYPLLADRLSKERMNPDDVELRVFRGKLTDVFRGTGASQNYYRRIRKILVEYGCITYLERGTKAYDSVLVLNHEPPQEISSDLLTGEAPTGTVQELANRMESLEGTVEGLKLSLGGINLTDALTQMESRLTKAERVIGKREV